MNLLEVQGLVKKFGSAIAVNEISFTIKEGHCVALLGPNGAGKTTALKMMAGLLQPSSGTIRFGAGPAASDTPANETPATLRPVSGSTSDIRSIIGFLPQYPSFYNWMSGREYLIFSGRLARMSKQEAAGRADRMLETVGLKDAAKKRIGGYSGGMKQRLGIAQALIHRPRLLLLDEPVSALDPIGRREVLDMIRSIQKETTVLFSTHVLHDAEEVCSDIMIMNKGRIVVSGTLDEVRREYSDPVIRVQSELPVDDHVERWSRLECVRDVEAGRYEAKITVSGLPEARAVLWEDLLVSQVPVTRFEAGRTTLEELFMKAVRE
ncbi:ABC transporter ATP-binding protein [Paenibacillus oceani]|uniref:ABC transporter ATP-binding protein n=1 Tax=Paenibacillus oceani TaxID=2772510 RepID=A0A927CAB0_9BACL|nr:ABC transporter ATP-binding protein [Paenibacillus oceani]MBD2864343.1 ABC transporter ATP-binding protein [Paenibacillus oceani]